MIELTDEMATRLSKALADGCPVIAASVDADGQPKLAFYGSTHVHDADHLALWARNPSSCSAQSRKPVANDSSSSADDRP